jgi:hypothetical protein
MSIELFVYAKKASTFGGDQLAAKLAEKDWHVFYMVPSGSRGVDKVALGDQLIYGARTVVQMEEGRKLIRSRREKELEKAFESGSIAACELTICPEGASDGLDESLPRKLMNLLAATKVTYCLRTSAGRSILSVELQNATWEAIGELSGGVLENPQEGSYFTVGAKGKKTLSKSDNSPIDVLGIYFRAAKAKGFPVELNNDEIFFHPEKLSEADLEQFLKFTKDHRWPDPEYVSGMVGMILDEYKFKKGAAFAKAKAKWLAGLERTYGF